MPSREPMFCDFVVFIPGIMGSRLWREGKEIWGMSARQLTRLLLSGGNSLRELALPAEVNGPASDGVSASGLIQDLHVIPGLWSAQLGYESVRRWFLGTLPVSEVGASLRPGNFMCFAYDWRLSNSWNALKLKETVEPALAAWRREARSTARLFLVCHSMGGLVGRYFASKLDDGRLTKALITLGTPHRGALKALSALGAVNGSGGWLTKLRIGDVVTNFPSIHELLPRYACLEGSDGLKTIAESTLGLRSSRHYLAATEFHRQIDDADHDWFEHYAFVGRGQDTFTTGRRVEGQYVAHLEIDGEWRGGDGTVPEFAARPAAWAGRDYRLRGVHERHGSIIRNPWVRQELLRILTEDDQVFRMEPAHGIRMDLDFQPESRTLKVSATTVPGRVLRVEFDDATDNPGTAGIMTESSPGHYVWSATGVHDGAFVAKVSAVGVSASVDSGVRFPLFVLGGSLVT